jgi:maltose alpha-D-glucosyltransferase / alpha-amylase
VMYSSAGSILIDASFDHKFCLDLLEAFMDKTPRITRGLEPRVIRGEQSNTSIVYGKKYVLKLVRRLKEGTSPDVEIGRFLTDRTRFKNTPASIGSLEYVHNNKSSTLGSVSAFVPNRGDAWTIFMTSLKRFCAKTTKVGNRELEPFLKMAELLGKRTMQLHLALASDPTDQSFAPIPFSYASKQDLSKSLRKQARQAIQALRKARAELPISVRPFADELIGAGSKIDQRFGRLRGQKIKALQSRIHGDYHLGQVLFDGRDFYIIDFEGEPARSYDERKLKSSPLRDVAGMLRSFHYAANVALMEQGAGQPRNVALEQNLKLWHERVCAAFLNGYFKAGKGAPILPTGKQETQLLLETYLLQKAFYELMYEINHRPAWVLVPILGILELISSTKNEERT